MKTLHCDNRDSFLEELDGKVYAVCKHNGHYLCDILEDDYIKFTDDKTLVDICDEQDYPMPDDCNSDVFFRDDIGKNGYEEFKEKYGVIVKIDKNCITLDAIKTKAYFESEVCMDELLASESANGMSIKDAFELYIQAMNWSDGDRFYRILGQTGEKEEL